MSILNTVHNYIMDTDFIAIFLGFCSGLMVEAFWDWWKNSSQEKQLINNLIVELLEAKDNIIKYSSATPKELHITPYLIPTWHGACASGSILLLSQKKYYFSLLNAFSTIDDANKIEQRFFEMAVGQNDPSVDNSTIFYVLDDNRKYVLTHINTALSAMPIKKIEKILESRDAK